MIANRVISKQTLAFTTGAPQKYATDNVLQSFIEHILSVDLRLLGITAKTYCRAHLSYMGTK
ncbi:MAG TPA: hypothetical protein IGR89_14050 [Oscillatoriaceae cyanobacterium M7585_C2015_266]|nr:hypothetical protein [Oscillatoriaceae cyanobacterium M7585_C2015_266]